MRKIKIKDSHQYHSISNRFFQIEKGQIVSVDDSFPLNLEVFDIVEENGEPVEKPSKVLTEEDIQEMLVPFDLHPQFELVEGRRTKVNDSITKFKARLAASDFDYDQVQQLLEAEKKGKRGRPDFIEHMELIPEAKATGINITEQTMFMNDLRTIPFVTDKGVHLIIKKFETKKDLIKAMQNKNKFFDVPEYRNDFTPQFMEHMKKHYGLIKSVVTTLKHIRRRAAPKAPAQAQPAEAPLVE